MGSKGFFISLEGIDGCGKTSVITNIKANTRFKQVITIREPGGTELSEELRNILLNGSKDKISAEAEALLYAAARAQLVKEIIKPAMDDGRIVIADRFMDSTIAYQGYGRGLDISRLRQLNLFATGGIKPDLTILLDLDPEMGYERRKGKDSDRIEIEGLSFQNTVREGFLAIARQEPERIKIIDARAPLEKVMQDVFVLIDDIYGN